ncbi:TetR/AcrR family transcriptional regulator [Pseudonocardia spinosispora]|uniref:TetR/AcrR family transcriptional regulator n=1 Tax=Pseudonocardia spinosispora TaxID=103441 RepID=UPI00048C7340|nr:TetR/AcrR family transcriptional regulator [Pseudonocardia spinosispora]
MPTPKQSHQPPTGGATLRPGVTEAITAAALAELVERGYARLSMDGVARRAGVGKAALYRRWPTKQTMLTELIRDRVTEELPPQPATGALRSDLRELLTTFRAQLRNPLVADVALGLIAEARHDDALAEVLAVAVAAPRRQTARIVLQNAVDRGELPPGLDMTLGLDLLIAPLAFRMLVTHDASGDDYLDRLTDALEAALRAL